jgi:hypothetical protein
LDAATLVGIGVNQRALAHLQWPAALASLACFALNLFMLRRVFYLQNLFLLRRDKRSIM